MFGNCETGRLDIETRPTITVMIAMDHRHKSAGELKKFDMVIWRAAGAGEGAGA